MWLQGFEAEAGGGSGAGAEGDRSELVSFRRGAWSERLSPARPSGAVVNVTGRTLCAPAVEPVSGNGSGVITFLAALRTRRVP